MNNSMENLIIEKEPYKRKKLGEGRNYGMGFTFFNKKRNKLIPLIPFTACRDYFNDIVYCENNKTEIGTIYGFNHKLINLKLTQRYHYLGINMLNYLNGAKWPDKEKADKELFENFENLLKVIHYLESELRLKTRTSFLIKDGFILLKVPAYFFKATYLNSLYTSTVRCYFNFKGEVNYENLKNHSPFIGADAYKKNELLEVLKNIKYYRKLNKKGAEIFYPVNPSNSAVHNYGINAYRNYLKTKYKKYVKI